MKIFETIVPLLSLSTSDDHSISKFEYSKGLVKRGPVHSVESSLAKIQISDFSANNNIKSDDWVVLDYKPVTRLEFQFMSSVEKVLSEYRSKSIEEISFRQSFFGDNDAGIFTRALHGIRFHRLCLAKVTMTDKAAHAMAIFLSRPNHGIQSIEFDECAISKQAWQKIIYALMINPKANHLVSLTLKDYYGPMGPIGNLLASNILKEFTFSSYKGGLRKQPQSPSRRPFSGFLRGGDDDDFDEEVIFLVGLGKASNIEKLDLSLELCGFELDFAKAFLSKPRLQSISLKVKDGSLAKLDHIFEMMRGFRRNHIKSRLFVGESFIEL